MITLFNELGECFSLFFDTLQCQAPRLLVASLFFSAVYLAGRVVARLICRVTQSMSNEQASAMLWLRSAVRVAFAILGALVALSYLKVDLSALITSLGLTGFAVGFALKDILSNTLAGLLIMFYRPFSLNDEITVGSAAGRVCQMDLRYTVLATPDDERFYVPNSTLFSQVIKQRRKASSAV